MFLQYFFQDLLQDGNSPQDPVIFFRDINFCDLENLVKFIYTGSVEVPGPYLESFLEFAKSLGVIGFSGDNADCFSKEHSIDSLTAKKKLFPDPCDKRNQVLKSSSDKENVDPKCQNRIQTPNLVKTPTITNNKNALNSLLNSSSKKRKILVKSEQITNKISSVTSINSPLVDQFSNVPTNKNHQSITNQPIYKNTGNFPATSLNTSSLPTYANVSHSNSKSSSSTHSTNTQVSPKHQESHSFDSHFLDPDELAAKGATLLHHLAVWMIQQNQGEKENHHPFVPDEMPPPADSMDKHTVVANKTVPFTTNKNSPHKHSHSLPIRRQSIVQCNQMFSSSSKVSSKFQVKPAVTDCDRPDSGFDPKEDHEEDEDVANKENIEDGSSPEIREISRQAMARQPVVKKKRILQTKS